MTHSPLKDAFPFADDVGGIYSFTVNAWIVTCLLHHGSLLAMITPTGHGRGEVCVVPLQPVLPPNPHPLDEVAEVLSPFARRAKSNPGEVAYLLEDVCQERTSLDSARQALLDCEKAIQEAELDEDQELLNRLTTDNPSANA